MNSHQRRKNLVKHHMEFPLGSHVVWFSPHHGPIIGKVNKHWTHGVTITHDHPGLNAAESRTSYRKIVLLDVHRRGERPWWRVHLSQIDPTGTRNKRDTLLAGTLGLLGANSYYVLHLEGVHHAAHYSP